MRSSTAAAPSVAVVCALAVTFSATRVSAQTLTDSRTWFNVTAMDPAGTASPLRWYMEAQWRYRDGFSDVDQLFLRPAIGYQLTNESSVWVGYAYGATYPASGGTVAEHRAWQQYWWIKPALGGVVQSRTRLEQRSIEGNDRVSWRARTFARFQKPLTRRAGLALVVYDEVFVHVNDTRLTLQGFDQNRVFAGVGVSVHRGRFELGYLNQAMLGGNAPNRQNHVLMSFLSLTY